MTDTPLPEPVLAWLAHLQTARRYSPHTLAAYRRDLATLVALSGDTPLQSLTPALARRFLGKLHAQGLLPRSIARVLASWRGFYHWWAPQAGLPANPMAGLRGPRIARGLPKALSVDQTQALLDHRPGDRGGVAATLTAEQQWVATRDQAMFELLYSSGLRLSELIGLDVAYVKQGAYTSAGWLDLDQGEVNVLGKGGKRRAVPVGRTALDGLAAWLQQRAQLAGRSAEPVDQHALFLGVRGRRISPRVVQAQLAAWAKSAQTPAHVHPHVLRHSFASHVLQSAEDLRAVQEMLGHASISTTQVYTRLDFQHLAKVYDKAHPRASRVGAAGPGTGKKDEPST